MTQCRRNGPNNPGTNEIPQKYPKSLARKPKFLLLAPRKALAKLVFTYDTTVPRITRSIPRHRRMNFVTGKLNRDVEKAKTRKT